MLVENCRKRSISEDGDGSVVMAGKRLRTPAIVNYSDDDEDGEELPIREETIAEVMKWLEKELVSRPNTTAMSDSTSCGPFFSDQSSTVMCGFSHISYPNQHANFILSQSVFNFNFYPSPSLISDEKQSYYNWETSKLFGNNDYDPAESEKDEQREQVSGNTTSDENEMNGSDDFDEQCDDNWLEMILTGDGIGSCPIDLEIR